MKISIKNFGPIDHFEFDLEKDLHVIYGENNIGKSWAIESLYLLLKFWREKSGIVTKYEGNDGNLLYKLNFQKIDLLVDFNNSFDNTFNEMKNVISGIEPEIIINTEIVKIKLNRRNEQENAYSSESRIAEFNGTYTLVNNDSINHLFFIENIYFLPASKSGIYQVLSNMGNIFAQLSQLPLKNTSLNLPSMSNPVSDYILNIAAINGSTQGEFGSFVDFLEEKVIEGSVVFDDLQKKLKYKSNRTGLVSELHEASSMIAEVSPLVAYLKYILPKKNSILFIEEPEAHLHPKVQVEMMKIFVDLAKSGVKVVMTTHSDFMMDTLTNQILDGKIEAEKIASYHLKMGEKGSYDVGDMKATSEGIRDFNFSETSIALYEERMQLLEKKQEAEDAD
ncbi:MAG: AAA family ATPase [Emticicia sp.]|nr:AAA family ATPase [Emticicia sp.]